MNKRKVKMSMTLFQVICMITFFTVAFTTVVLIRCGMIQQELKEAQEELARTEGITLDYNYIYTPTEGYEIVDGFLPDDVYDMDEFNKAACMIAQTLYGESRGLSMYEQSMVVWTILNRFDSGRYGASIEDVITAPNQFHGYKSANPIDGKLYNLAVDVMMRWSYEPYCEGEVGRTLPKEYIGFYGKNGHNYFRDSKGNIFDFSSKDPYGDKGGI